MCLGQRFDGAETFSKGFYIDSSLLADNYPFKIENKLHKRFII